MQSKVDDSTYNVPVHARILWLFDASTAIFPSGYLRSPDNSTANRNHVYGTVMEARRVRDKLGQRARHKPIYLYSRFTYHSGTQSWFKLVSSSSRTHDSHIA